MKILLHTCWGIHEGFVGGTERFLLNLAKGIRKKGDETFIVCSNLEEKINLEGVPIFGIVPKEYKDRILKYGYANENFFRNEIISKDNKLTFVDFSKYVFDQIKEFYFDIAHLNAFLYSLSIPLNLDLSKFIVTNHENPEEIDHYWGNETFQKLSYTIRNISNSLSRFKGRITPSKYYAEVFTKSFGIPITSIPLGVSLIEFSELNRTPLLRNQYAQQEETIILLPSRFDIEQKGHDIAIESLGILKKKGIHFKAVFSGYDELAYKSNLIKFEQIVKEVGIKDNIILTKFKDIREAYNIADIVISPERFCSYGLSISESLALGIPTILSPIPTYKEIASGYKHAHFMTELSTEALTKKLLDVIISGFELNQKEALRFRNNNNFEHCVDSYYNLYHNFYN